MRSRDGVKRATRPESCRLVRMQNPDTFVFFDFDGVIADSFGHSFVMAQKLCVHMNEDKYRGFFDGNINDWEMDDGVLDHSTCKHELDWWDNYLHSFNTIQPFPGAVNAVREVSGLHRSAIISSTISRLIDGFLVQHDIRKDFLEIMGNDVHEKKYEKMHMLIEKYALDPRKCVIVTDTLGRHARSYTSGRRIYRRHLRLPR